MILIKDRHNFIRIKSSIVINGGTMILIKDRHRARFKSILSLQWGTMILIKDRHGQFSKVSPLISA